MLNGMDGHQSRDTLPRPARAAQSRRLRLPVRPMVSPRRTAAEGRDR